MKEEGADMINGPTHSKKEGSRMPPNSLREGCSRHPRVSTPTGQDLPTGGFSRSMLLLEGCPPGKLTVACVFPSPLGTGRHASSAIH